VHRLSRGQQNKGKMSDSETPRQVEYGYEDGPQKQILDWLAAVSSSSRNIVTLLQLHLKRPGRNIDIWRLDFSFDFCNFYETVSPRYLSAISD
jgi:hypothetical protein